MLAFISLFIVPALAQSTPLTINTPASLLTCEPSLLSWSGGVSPYFVSVIPGGNPSGSPLVEFGQQASNSITWLVRLPVGTSISLQIKDSTGAINYSQAVSVGAGATATCAASSVSGTTSVPNTAGLTSTSRIIAGQTSSTTSVALTIGAPAARITTSITTKSSSITSVTVASSAKTTSTAPVASTTTLKSRGFRRADSVLAFAGIAALVAALHSIR